jgi:hypothetical protein
MVAPHAANYLWVMTTTTVTSSTPTTASQTSATVSRTLTTPTDAAPASRPLAAIAALVLAGFGAFSIWVVATQGYFGFLDVAGRERWGLQMLLDLVIALSVAIGWMRGDARQRGIAIWPYVIATVLLGSIGVLAYCVRRGAAVAR